MGKQKILFVEDDQNIQKLVNIILQQQGYDVIDAWTGKAALTHFTDQTFDLVILDLGLPDMDGLEILKIMRQVTQIPIIILTARSHEQEKVKAFDLGADDYVTKPFGTQEFLARIRTVFRRVQLTHQDQTSFAVGKLFFDFTKRKVLLDNHEIHFTPTEYLLLSTLAKHAGQVLTYDYLMKIVWGPYVDERQALRVNMANIRRKIEKDVAVTKYIQTEIGVGYRLLDKFE